MCACLCLFYEQVLNITASGTLDGYEVERNKDEEKMRERRSDERGQRGVEEIKTEEEGNKEDRKEENLMGRRSFCLQSKSGRLQPQPCC